MLIIPSTAGYRFYRECRRFLSRNHPMEGVISFTTITSFLGFLGYKLNIAVTSNVSKSSSTPEISDFISIVNVTSSVILVLLILHIFYLNGYTWQKKKTNEFRRSFSPLHKINEKLREAGSLTSTFYHICSCFEKKCPSTNEHDYEKEFEVFLTKSTKLCDEISELISELFNQLNIGINRVSIKRFTTSKPKRVKAISRYPRTPFNKQKDDIAFDEAIIPQILLQAYAKQAAIKNWKNIKRISFNRNRRLLRFLAVGGLSSKTLPSILSQILYDNNEGRHDIKQVQDKLISTAQEYESFIAMLCFGNKDKIDSTFNQGFEVKIDTQASGFIGIDSTNPHVWDNLHPDDLHSLACVADGIGNLLTTISFCESYLKEKKETDKCA